MEPSGRIRPRPRRIERRVLFAAKSLTREFDEMIGHKFHAEGRADLAASWRVTRSAPERATIIRYQADPKHDIEREDEGPAKISHCQSATHRRVHAVSADEDCEKLRLAHQRKDFSLLGEIERRLARKLQRVAMLALPVDQMRQYLSSCLAVADEIVVDEIHP
jgi:hypothetical protein